MELHFIQHAKFMNKIQIERMKESFFREKKLVQFLTIPNCTGRSPEEIFERKMPTGTDGGEGRENERIDSRVQGNMW